MPTMMVTLGTISGKQAKKGMQITCYTTIQSFYGVIYILGWFFCPETLQPGLYDNSRWISSLSPFSALHNPFCHLSSALSCSLHPVFHAFFPCPALFIITLSLSLFSLSLCCCELTFPCAAGVVVPRSERELLRKHLRLPTSLWLCSFPNFATGPFEVMNEKWQYLKAWPIRNRLVRAIHKQLETSCKYWSAGAQSVFLLLWSKALIQNQHPLGRTTPGFYFLYLFDLKWFDSVMIEVPNMGHSYIQSTFPNATGLTSDLVVLGRRRT